ncbi:response regulator transcription factor, partial [Clostridium fessum]|uniref:response regulator transcription factor n=1 Tax=Clostridium fessum TaxID=2126740 RepID=UPI0022E989F5
MFHILVVEDDAKLRSLFCTVLTNNGYLALPAESGEKALSLLDSEYVDLIISDIMMSGMDGYELFYPQLGVKLCSMAGGGVQKIYMVFLREPSRR